MTIRGAPQMRFMTAQSFFAMDAPPASFGDTFSGSAAEAFNTSPGLGLALREARTPDLAIDRGVSHPTLDSGQPPPLPHMPGQEDLQKPEFGTTAPWEDPRLGARPTSRVMTPQEVRDRGDTLFSSEEEMRQSPYWREAIPFEPGMTVTRLQALSEEYDLAQVRQFYSEKRPVAAILGALAGTAVEPANYIPIFGEGTGALAVARLGRIGGRALVGAGEAAINTGMLEILTATERAKWGDDTSWQAMATDIAFAAVAGSVFGAALGRKVDDRTLEAFRSAKNNQRAAMIFNDAIDGFLANGEVQIRNRDLLMEVSSDAQGLDMRTSTTIGGRLVGEVRGYEVPMTRTPEFNTMSGSARMPVREAGQLVPTTQTASFGNVDAVDKVRKLIDRRTVTAKDLEAIGQEEVDGILKGTLRLAAEYVTGIRKMPEAPTLLGWMRGQGGIKDTGGDVNHVLGGANKTMPGLVKKSAKMDLDAWGEKLQQEFPDVFPSRPSPNDVLTLIDDASRGDVQWFKDKMRPEKGNPEAMKLAEDLANLEDKVGQLDTLAKVAELFKSDEFQTFNDLVKREAEMGKTMPVRYDNSNYHVPADANLDPVYDFDYADASKVTDNIHLIDDEVRFEIERAEAEGIDTSTWRSSTEDEIESYMKEEGLFDPEEIEAFRKEFATEDENMKSVDAYNDALDEIYQCAQWRL